MTLSAFGALAAVWAAAITLPGPDVLQIVRMGTKNRHLGMWCALGVMTGSTIWIVGSLLGIVAVFAARPEIVHLIQLVGGLYIAWMGMSSVRPGWRGLSAARHGPAAETVLTALAASVDNEETRVTRWSALRAGLATNLSNPKAVVFFSSIFAQFVNPNMGTMWTIVIAVFLIVSGLVWFIGLACAVRVVASALMRNSAWIDLGAGVIFLVIGVIMAIEGVAGIVS